MKIRKRKTRPQRALAKLPDVGSGKARKVGLIAAGSLAGLTAASAGISSLRRQRERESRA